MKKIFIIVLLSLIIFSAFSQKYQNFKVSVYCTVYDVQKMNDTSGFLVPAWNEITRQLKVDKVYLETHRDMVMIDQKTLDIAKNFFINRGIEISGGITFTIDESNNFQTFCYNDPEQRKKVKEIAEFTAKNFDSFILDDFFFTSCKSDGAIKDKGELSWTQYRLKLMTEAAKNLVIGPAKEINPKVKITIKYPNWYDHFQGLGFNLETEPGMFDGIYTGTETRDAMVSEQHLQPYLGYNIFRYFEHIAPGRNGGGWVDPFGMNYYDRYAEQLWITAFAKAPEITLFHFGQLLNPLDNKFISPWQNDQTSFHYKSMLKPVNYNGGKPTQATTLARVAGYSFETADNAISKTGKPIGIKSYKPYHSIGEDFLHNYTGMIGIPMDVYPYFPEDEQLVFLTECAKYDENIISKIKNELVKGHYVVITSGLLRELQNKGLNDIVELRYLDRKAIVTDYTLGNYQMAHGNKPVLIQQIRYLTNDSWEIVSGISGDNGWPIMHMADYSKGKLFVLTIPDNFADLYNFPPEVLNKIRGVLCGPLDIAIEGPSKIAVYLYDNNTFIVESFLDTETSVKIVSKQKFSEIKDLTSNEVIEGKLREERYNRKGIDTEAKNTFDITVQPHSFRVFSYE